MSAGHTPGPWLHVEWQCEPRVNGDGNRYWEIRPATFHSGVQYLVASGWMTEANARLLAAAPELLEALVEILGPLKVCSDNPHVRDDVSLPVDMTMGELRRARAAIAKATGAA